MTPNELRGAIVNRRTYQRPLDEDGTIFETREQQMTRVIGHQRWLWERALGRALDSKQEGELAELEAIMLSNRGSLSGRTLWLGGTDIGKKRELSQFNCSFLELRSVHDYVDMMWLLLNGVGAGFWPKPGMLNGFQKPIKKVTVRRSERTIEQWRAGERGRENNEESFDQATRTWTISVGDSAEAWAKAVGKLLAGKYAADHLVFDLTQIRPAGLRLKGYGWISNGDGTLATALEAIAGIMSRMAGRLLSFSCMHDIANWCGSVLSTRRSAQIALCDADAENWAEFATFKKDYWRTGNPQRALSNNSLVFERKPERARLESIFDLMLASGGSEPGFINGRSAHSRAPWFSGMNPCLTARTLVAVPGRGLIRIGDLAGGSHPVIDQNGNVVDAEFRQTSDSEQIFEVELSNGTVIEATAYHDMIRADGSKVKVIDLVPGEPLMVADIEGRWGSTAATSCAIESARNACHLDSVPAYVLRGDLRTTEAFINSLPWFDRTELNHPSKSFLCEVSALLAVCGEHCQISKAGDGSFLLSILYCAPDSMTVAAVRQTDRFEPVFCAGVPTTASFALPWVMSGNCGEILLSDKGFCNLATLNLGAFHDDPSGMLRAAWLLARANYRQTCVDLRDGILQEAWHQNNSFLRLCGMSLTGQAMRPDLTSYDYRVLRNEAVAGAYSMAHELDMPRPKNVTTGKPEGTGSKVMGATEGAHKPLARYVFNNITFGGHDPLVPLLRAANYKVIQHPLQPDDVVITLPVSWDTVEFDRVGDLEVNLDSAVSQLNHYKMLMDNYIEQNQSVTISYDPTEVPAIIDWLMVNWDSYVGVSFLLRTDPTKTAEDLGYPYLPQQPVSAEVYQSYVSQLLPVDLDADSGEQLLQIDDCSTGACPIR